MQFHAEFTPKPFTEKINHADNILLIGSCFTEQMGTRMAAHKFSVLENPHGILFNPVSIANALESYAIGKMYQQTDLFHFNELWASWDHHTKYSGNSAEETLQKINRSQQDAATFTRSADWVIVTLGSAFVYEIEDGISQAGKRVAANCHKMPAVTFNHRLLSVAEVSSALERIWQAVINANPAVKLIFTISPVRHLREGFIENNRSKAALIQAVHSLQSAGVYYFPAYELVIDDLRDYRFYAEDMVHPNYAATNYVWEKFTVACLDGETQALLPRINEVMAAYRHKPFNPASIAHQKFKEQQLHKISALQATYKYLDFTEEIKHFTEN